MSGERLKGDDVLSVTTIKPGEPEQAVEELVVPTLTIAHHPDARRVGERSLLKEPAAAGRVSLSRLSPVFGAPGAPDSEPLGDPRLSRRPVFLEPDASGRVRLLPQADANPIEVDGVLQEKPRVFYPEDLSRGVVLELGQRVVLVLHHSQPLYTCGDDHGLMGNSDAIQMVRQQIERVAPHDVSVLVRGESGTGKELVARAIHRASKRAQASFVSVNMAAVPTSTAASSLFGHSKGAFTGAVDASAGYFGEADGGTLFLDEIGETPMEVQPALLRALESGEIQPLGTGTSKHCDVRLLAATDTNLELAVEQGGFRLPLLQRIAGYQLVIRPLRERRSDIGLLFHYFLRAELSAMDRLDRLSNRESEGATWLPSWLMVRALLCSWPGNVRQLRNAVRQIVIEYVDQTQVLAGDFVDRALGVEPSANDKDSVTTFVPETKNKGRTNLSEITEGRLLEVLREHEFRPGPAADALGVSRTSLYQLIETSNRIRKAGELAGDEIREALAAAKSDVPAAAKALEVSARGLRLRMKQLGLTIKI